MKSEPLISIIIPIFNRDKTIDKSLNSIINQTYTNWECILVDDGSTDKSVAILEEYSNRDSRFRFYKRPGKRVKGANSCRNYGFELSKGEYVKWFDSDDWLLKNHIEEKITVLRKNPNVDAVLTKTIMVNEHKEKLKNENRTKLSDNLIEDFITLKISWYIHDIMWKKTFLKGKTLYNEKLLKWQDRDFHIRRLMERPNIHLLDKYLSLYRVHMNSTSLNSNYKVLETRHNAVIDILDLLKEKKILSKRIKMFFFKFQVQNLLILYKSPIFFKMYFILIKKTIHFNFKYFIWVGKLIIGYISYKLTGKGLRFIQ
ncbi:glycosyltransferase family 2 protein [Polaribacter staleyi]|uniref:glycosyltransferase family 2 protein n=1 Tax=Polaribacter staleyi TaxID=2022337 RepID=UPI0031BAA46C